MSALHTRLLLALVVHAADHATPDYMTRTSASLIRLMSDCIPTNRMTLRQTKLPGVSLWVLGSNLLTLTGWV